MRTNLIHSDAAAAVPVKLLVPHPGNARRGNIGLIAESLSTLGQYRPVVVNTGTITGRPNEILAGHHLVLAAEQLGWKSVSALYVDVDDVTARKILLADNRTSDVAAYDDRALADLLSSLPGLVGTGFNQADLDKLVASLEGPPEDGFTGPDDAPPVRPDPVSRVGDIWHLGPHRLLVGDCTNRALVSDMMAGDLADVVWTDPPYGVDYVGGTKDKLTIQGDGAAGLASLLSGAFSVMAAVARPGAPCYIAHGGAARVTFETAMNLSGIKVRQDLVWVKSSLVLGRSDFHYRHEPIMAAEVPVLEPDTDGDPDEAEDPKTHEVLLYGFTPAPKGSGRLGRGGPQWFGGNKQSTVFEVPKPAANRDHPTMKPTELIEKMLRVSCRPDGLVYDGFGGSGSTLIAAHRLGRRAALVELDPRYADVICRRWTAFTHLPATRGDEQFPADAPLVTEGES